MNKKRKHIRPRGCFPDTKEGWDAYNAQFENKTHQEIWEDDFLDKASDIQHARRENGDDIIDDMSIRMWQVR